jgi:DNA-binding CsgD family transcriptional regulator
MESDLVDRIYESAFVPELWPAVLAELSEIAGARTGFLFVSRSEIHNWTSSNKIGVEALAPLVAKGVIARCERFTRMLERSHAGFLTEADIYDGDEMRDDPFYRDIIYPRGLGWAAGTSVHLPTGDYFSMSLERELARGPVEPERIARLDTLRPHLGRGALMSSRMRLEQAGTISQALGAIGLAAAVLDETGRALATNSLIDALTDHIQSRALGKLGLLDKKADRLLREAVAHSYSDPPGSVRSFPLRGAEDVSSMIAHVIPVRLSARDIFTRSAAVLVLTPLGLPAAAPVELVQSLFDLTPAEARVARSLAAGKTADEIALDGGVTINTVRAQVRGVLEKTGCARQTDVVALLTAISSSTPAPAA